MTNTTLVSDRSTVRDQLLATFTADEFRDILLYTENTSLRPLVQEFSSEDDLADLVAKALAYCSERSLLHELVQAVNLDTARPEPEDALAKAGKHACLSQKSGCFGWGSSRAGLQRRLQFFLIGLYPSVGIALAVVTGWLDPAPTLAHAALAGCVYLCWAAFLIGPADVIRWVKRQPPLLRSDAHSRRTLHRNVALLIGLPAGLLRLVYALSAGAAGDFGWALIIASDLLGGRDPYGFVASALRIPYPLPVALFGLPLLVMPMVLAAVLFVGLSSALLAYGILRKDHGWRLLLFLTPAFLEAVHWAQWSPLITASWFIPILAPLLVLIKPQTALPVALNRPSRRGLFLAFLVLSVSLVIYPQWPIRWYGMLEHYQRVIPILELPLGPFLFLSAVFPRSPRARLLLFMSLLPLREVYDLVPLYIIPDTGIQMVVLVALAWLDPIGRVSSWVGHNSAQMINSHHFYALCILMYSHRESILSAWLHIKAAPRRFRRTNTRSTHDQ